MSRSLQLNEDSETDDDAIEETGGNEACTNHIALEDSELVDGMRSGPSNDTGVNASSTFLTETCFAYSQLSTSRERVARFRARQSILEREKRLA